MGRAISSVLPADDPEERRRDALLDLVPAEPYRSYDMRAVIAGIAVIAVIADGGEHVEVPAAGASDVARAFTRPTGQVVGFVAPQPAASAGVLDVRAGDATARFVVPCERSSARPCPAPPTLRDPPTPPSTEPQAMN